MALPEGDTRSGAVCQDVDEGRRRGCWVRPLTTHREKLPDNEECQLPVSATSFNDIDRCSGITPCHGVPVRPPRERWYTARAPPRAQHASQVKPVTDKAHDNACVAARNESVARHESRNNRISPGTYAHTIVKCSLSNPQGALLQSPRRFDAHKASRSARGNRRVSHSRLPG